MAKRFSNNPLVAAGGLNKIVVGGRLDSRGSDRILGFAVVAAKVVELAVVVRGVVVVVVSTGRNADPVRGANCAGLTFGGWRSERTIAGCLTSALVEVMKLV